MIIDRVSFSKSGEKRASTDGTFNLNHVVSLPAKRLHGINKHKRDLIVYLLWNKGLMTNEQLGRFFNISYSAISHSVKIFKDKMINDKKVKNQFDKINSQIKV